MSLLVLGLAVAALAFASRRFAGRRASLGALLIGYGAPALFLAFVLLTSRDDATRFRFALLGLGFRGEAGRPFQVPIGGDRDRDGVWISALAEEGGGTATALGSLVFLPPETDDAGTVGFAPSPEASAGLLGVRTDEGLRPLRAIALADGDRLSVAGRAWEVELDTGWLGPPAALVADGGLRVELPARVGRLPLGIGLRILRPLPAVVETYDLGWLERKAGGVSPEASPGFLFWEPRGLFGRRLWIAPADASATVERGGETLEAAAGSTPDGVHVLSPPRRTGAAFAAGGVRDRRSFRLLPGRRGFALTYDTPEVYVLSRSSLEALAIDPQGSETVRFNLAMGGWQVTDESLYFRHASRRVALEALATLELPRAVLEGFSGRREVVAATPRGQRRGDLGEPLWLGGDNLAAVQVDVLRPPLGLAALALALAVLKALAARSARLSVVHLGFAAPLEALVAVRLLLGYRVWAMPPFDQEALELALAAWALLPWSLILAAAAASRVDDETRGRLVDVLPALGGALFAFAWCWTLGGGGVRRWVWVACLAAAAGAWAVRAAGGPDRLTDVVSRWTAKARGERRVLALWTVAAFVPSLARLALLLFGNRESLLVGNQRFALSLVHVPAALLLEAACLVWLWRRMEARQALRAADLVPALAVVVGTWLVPGPIANDLGLALLNVPVFLLALASLTLAARRRLAEDGLDGGRLHALPALALAVYLVFVAFPLGARALLAVVPRETELALESERNYLRLLAFAYPARLEQVARRTSEELAVMSAVMRRYTSGPFAGRGWFGSELSPHIRATALREHAPAVFVAAEWGLAGVLGLLLVYSVVGAAGRALPAWAGDERGPPSSYWGTASYLAALTVAIPSVYMLLANYRLTLFTGKNVYLLGLDSTADVLEVFLLTALFAFGASVVGEEEE
jgi:hypothetical protein